MRNCQAGDALSTSEAYKKWLDGSTHVANLKVAIAIQASILVMGTMLVTHDRQSAGLGVAVLLVAYNGFCGYLANFKYKLACVLVAVPNLSLAVIIASFAAVRETYDEPLVVLWIIGTSLVGLVAAILARVSGVPSQTGRAPDLPEDDA